MIFEKSLQKIKLEVLNNFWGFQEFRKPQEEIIDAIVSGNDTLALLPTGAGKSLCFQLPSLITEGTCLVISPLLALMKEQVFELQKKGIEAELLSSELSDEETELIFNRCKEGVTKILYVSPERLSNQYFLQNIEEISVSFLAVDEAHCISEWGQDFRPSFENIRTFRKEFKKVPCIALTATATPKVLNDIVQKLELKSPKIFKNSFKRENISIECIKISDKYQTLYDFLKVHQQSGIIYTVTRKDAEELSKFLQKKGLQNVDYYHAGLTPSEKNRKQKNWKESQYNVLVSTNAFGMGIDKEDLHIVIHYSPPTSIENYFQEIGRVGRDGDESYALMLWNEQELKNFDNILKNQTPSKSEYRDIIKFLYSIYQIGEGDSQADVFAFDIEKLKKLSKCSGAKIRNVLNFLNNQEIIYFDESKGHSSVELLISPHEIELLPSKDTYFIELLLRNLDGVQSSKINFNEYSLAKKLNVDQKVLKDRFQELKKQEILKYTNGEQGRIKFLVPRNSLTLETKYEALFFQIQKNKIQKWEEMKFYIQNEDFCRMKIILSYFGEKNIENCGKCDYCRKKENPYFGNNISLEIERILASQPSTFEEINAKIYFVTKEDLLENIINLLDLGKIKMLDFRTYTLA